MDRYWREQWNCTNEEVKKYDFHARFNECCANLFHIFSEKKNYVVKNGRNCAIEFIYGKTFFLYSIFNTFLSERCIRFMIRVKITRFNIRTVYFV